MTPLLWYLLGLATPFALLGLVGLIFQLGLNKSIDSYDRGHR